MFARVGRWTLVAVAGILVIGLVGVGVSYAQGPKPAAPRGPEGAPGIVCPLGRVAGPWGGQSPLGAGMGWRRGGEMPQVWADALGMTLDELRAALQDGKTVAGLAEEKGVTVEALVEEAIAARQPGLAEAVEAGRLTQAQADAMIEQMRTRMTESLQNGTCNPSANCPRLGGDGEARRGRMGGFGRGMRRAAPADPA